MKILVRNIPNTITCINLIAGCLAIISAMSPDTCCDGLSGRHWAYICICIAAVADFCDGLAARLLHAYSPMGKELDSLCDLVSFGVAPAMLAYQCMKAAPETATLAPAAIFIAVCGALRLARFNVDERQTSSFIGLPIPANAIFWIGLTEIIGGNAASLGLIPSLLIIIAASLLMVLPLPMFSLKFKNLRWQGNRIRWIMIAAAIVLTATLGVGGLMWVIVAYLLLSIANNISTKQINNKP